MKKFLKITEEFWTYIGRNTHMIPNYDERYRNHERIATSFVESAVDVVIAKRFNKKLQKQWTRRGAYMLLQIRTRTLDGTLRNLFDEWYPNDRAANDDSSSEQAKAA